MIHREKKAAPVFQGAPPGTGEEDRLLPSWPASDCFILSALVILFSLFNYAWVRAETRPPHWDMARHLWTSLNYLNLLHLKTFYRLWTNYYYYPPFRYWLTLPFYLIFGTSMTVAIMSNIVFVCLLTFSIYGIGFELWNRTTGLLGALFILSTPIIASQFKEYQLDAPLTAMAALSLLLLIRTHEFSRRPQSLLFGLSFGLGMLTKWTFFHCMILPLAFAIWKVVRIPDKKRAEKNPTYFGPRRSLSASHFCGMEIIPEC